MSTHPGPDGATPAGWYNDGTGALRWWDGEQWTQLAQGSGMPSGQSAGQQGKSRVPLIIGIVTVVVLAATGVLLWLFVFSGDGPEEVIEKSLQTTTCAEEEQYLTGRALAENKERQAAPKDEDNRYACEWNDFSYTDIEMTTTAETGDTATVEVSLVERYSGAEENFPESRNFDIRIQLAKVDGKWLIEDSVWCAEGSDREECSGIGGDSG